MIDVEGIVLLGGSAPKKHLLLEKWDKEDQQNSTQKTNFSRNSMNEAASVEGNRQMMPWFRAFLQSLKSGPTQSIICPCTFRDAAWPTKFPPQFVFLLKIPASDVSCVSKISIQLFVARIISTLIFHLSSIYSTETDLYHCCYSTRFL